MRFPWVTAVLAMAMMTKCLARDGDLGTDTDTFMQVPGDTVLHRPESYDYTKHRETHAQLLTLPPRHTHTHTHTHGHTNAETDKAHLRTHSPHKIHLCIVPLRGLLRPKVCPTSSALLPGTVGYRAGAGSGRIP